MKKTIFIVLAMLGLFLISGCSDDKTQKSESAVASDMIDDR